MIVSITVLSIVYVSCGHVHKFLRVHCGEDMNAGFSI